MKNVVWKAVAALTMMVGTSQAAIVFNAVNPNDATLTAKATFDVIGGQLVVVLEATGSAADDNAEVLTGLLWVDDDTDGYAPDDATSEALILNDGTAFAGTDETEDSWRYQDPTSPPAHADFTDGLGAAGLSGAFGPDGNFGSSGNNVGGVDWGIVNGVAAGFGGNQEPFADDSVTFTFDDLDGLDLAGLNIRSVRFNWGSGFNVRDNNPGDPGNPPVPEPSALIVWSLLGLVAGGYKLARRAA